MTRLRVRLTYLEAPFAKYYLEAVPDLTGAVRERRMNAEAQALIEGLGFRITPPAMMDAVTQLAEKLHAISRPGKTRGRDVADIALILHNETIDEGWRDAFRPGSPLSFDEAWSLVQDVLRQAAGEPPAPPLTTPTPHGGGDVWVSPHVRNGRPVAGHWRRRPAR